jgi:hypothetical protein
MLRLTVATCFLAGRLVLGQQWPKWVPSAARDLFGELDEIVGASKAAAFGEEACDTRTKLMKALGPVTGPEKGQIMMDILSNLGFCELKDGKINAAMRRFQSAISELNAPNEDMLMQNMQTAPVLLMKEACTHLNKQAASRAAVEFRRTRTIYIREKAKMLKNVAKQNKVPPEQMENFVSNVMEKAKGGGQEAQQVKGLVKMINTFDATIENIENSLSGIQEKVAGDDAGKQKRKRLMSGSGPFVPALLMEGLIEAENLAAAESLQEKAAAIAKEVKEAKLTSTAKLIKRSKDAADCGKLPETCAAAKEVPDLATNGFGETRVLQLKSGKSQALDLCDTNANVLVLLPLDSGVSVKFDAGGEQALIAETAVVVDHCLPLSLKASDGAAVLAAQVWHPEFATIERTTEARDRASKWSFKEDEVKKLTADINAHGKKGWEKVIKKWMAGPVTQRLTDKLDAVLAAEREAKDKAAKDAEEKAKNEDEDRKKALEELEDKRKKKAAAQEAKEQARLANKKRMDEERAKKDPWLLDPAVIEAEKRLDELKEERRDANAKLEFDLTKQLTQDINAQERLITKTIKKARKAWKKGKTLGDAKPMDDDKPKDEAAGGAASELAAAEKKLAELKKKKDKAAADENYKLAKQLKKEQEELEKEVNALRAKSEL